MSRCAKTCHLVPKLLGLIGLKVIPTFLYLVVFLYAYPMASVSASNLPVASAACKDPPQVAAWTTDAGPDESLFLTATKLPAQVELALQSSMAGTVTRFPARWSDDSHVLAVLPNNQSNGSLVVTIGNGDCWSAPITLNAPQAWWSYPAHLVPGGRLRVFGRDLDAANIRIHLQSTAASSQPLKVSAHSKYWLEAELPHDLPPGSYQLWLDADAGSTQHSEPLIVEVGSALPVGRAIRVNSVETLRQALSDLTQSGGTIHLDEGHYDLDAPLSIPGRVKLEGSGIGKTVLSFAKNVMPTPGLVMKPITANIQPEPIPGKEGLPAIAGIMILNSQTGISDLSIEGNNLLEQAIAIAGTEQTPIQAIHISHVAIKGLANFHGLPGQVEAVLARHSRDLEITESTLMGTGPALFLEDVADSAFINNILAGGGEGVITGGGGGLHRVRIENNHILSKKDGAVQAVRAMWLSGLFGSVFNNYIAGNYGADFHPPPGTEQNRGEAMLFETALTHPYVGHPLNVVKDGFTLPQEGPDWELLKINNNFHATQLNNYFAVVIDGPGQGQVRRLAAIDDRKLRLDKPWRVIPDTNSTIVITELFYRNIVTNNEISDGKSCIQFWINGIENVIAENKLTKCAGGGITLYSAASGGPQNKPQFWPIVGHNRAGYNRGIGLNYFNSVNANQIIDAGVGVDILAQEFRAYYGPIAWPISMGNVVRHNQIVNPVNFGIWVGRGGGWRIPFSKSPGFSLLGDLIEHNEVSSVSNIQGLYAGDERGKAIAFRNNIGHIVDSKISSSPLLSKPNNNVDWLVENNVLSVLSANSQQKNKNPPP